MPKSSAKNLEQVVLKIAVELSVEAPSTDQYQKLVNALQQILPCDACALFVFDHHQQLVPVALNGLSTAVLGRTFIPVQHPRLDMILASRQPVRFPASSTLPDPFDGLLSLDANNQMQVHSCMGCSLYVGETLVGLLTLDAESPDAFEQIPDHTIETFAALAAGIIRNISLFEALQKTNNQQQSLNELLINEARNRRGKLIGVSPQMQQLNASIQMVAPSDYVVLISGETGTGKEVVAHHIHSLSRRHDKPMVYVNCAALPESLAESELFGHVKGAFTGANANRAGKFELADGGTIFLDEVGELPLLLQAKLLRVIQQGEVQRVGKDQNQLVDVRIIAATNRDLAEEVNKGTFRADLYHRLNVFPIHVPALRNREGDIPVLVGHILERLCKQFHRNKLHIHQSAIQMLEQYTWLGNVRELEHVLMRAALHAVQEQVEIITPKHFLDDLQSTRAVSDSVEVSSPRPLSSSSISMRKAVEDYQKQLIEHALGLSNGVWAQAAQFLQMDRGNLYKMGKKFGLTNTGSETFDG